MRDDVGLRRVLAPMTILLVLLAALAAGVSGRVLIGPMCPVEGVQPRAGLPRAPERLQVRVVAHRFARVVLRYDSGIR